MESSDWSAQSSEGLCRGNSTPFMNLFGLDLVTTGEETTKANCATVLVFMEMEERLLLLLRPEQTVLLPRQKSCRFLVKTVNLCHLYTEMSHFQGAESVA